MHKNRTLYKTPLRFCIIVATILFILSTNCLAESNANHTNGPQPYTANYIMRSFGMTLAVIHYQLTQEGNEYLFNTTAHPKGLAKLISSKPITEQSVLTWTENRLIPLHYKREHTGEKDAKVKDMQISYDQENGRATVTIFETKQEYSIENNLWDEASIQLAMMYDLEKGLTELNYRIISDDELNEHYYQIEGDEIIDTKIGKLSSIKLVRDHGKRKTIMWFAKNKNYIPVKVQRYKEGKLKSELLIKTLSL